MDEEEGVQEILAEVPNLELDIDPGQVNLILSSLKSDDETKISNEKNNVAIGFPNIIHCASKIGSKGQDAEEENEDSQNSDLLLNISPLLLPPTPPPIDADLKLYQCRLCDFFSLSSDIVAKHEGTDHPPPRPTIQCLCCPNIFFSVQALKVHLLLDHEVLKSELQSILLLTLNKCEEFLLSSNSNDGIQKLNVDEELKSVNDENFDSSTQNYESNSNIEIASNTEPNPNITPNSNIKIVSNNEPNSNLEPNHNITPNLNIKIVSNNEPNSNLEPNPNLTSNSNLELNSNHESNVYITPNSNIEMVSNTEPNSNLESNPYITLNSNIKSNLSSKSIESEQSVQFNVSTDDPNLIIVEYMPEESFEPPLVPSIQPLDSVSSTHTLIQNPMVDNYDTVSEAIDLALSCNELSGVTLLEELRQGEEVLQLQTDVTQSHHTSVEPLQDSKSDGSCGEEEIDDPEVGDTYKEEDYNIVGGNNLGPEDDDETDKCNIVELDNVESVDDDEEGIKEYNMIIDNDDEFKEQGEDDDNEDSIPESLTNSIKNQVDLMEQLKGEKYKGFKCSVSKKCRLRFKHETTLDYHVKCHDPVAKKFWRCPDCSKKFPAWNSLCLHVWHDHQIDLELYTCNFCSFRTPSLSILKTTHIWIHGKNKVHTCSICNKTLKTRKQLRNHKIFRSSGDHTGCLFRHFTCCARGIFSSDDSNNVINFVSTIMTSSPSEDLILYIMKPKQYDNFILFAKKLWSNSLSAFILSLTKAYHTKSLVRFECVLCKSVFSKYSSLRTHCEVVHDKTKKFQCPTCGSQFGSRYALRRHVLNHSREKKYKCSKCNFTADQPCTLDRHQFDHTGLAPYTCPHCNFSCFYPYYMKIHINQKHPEVQEATVEARKQAVESSVGGDVILSCPFCPFQTLMKALFVEHSSKHNLHKTLSFKELKCGTTERVKISIPEN